MGFNKRYAIESVMVSFGLIVVWIVGRIIAGIWYTRKYVPEIAESYSSVEFLQNKVSIGWMQGLGWLNTVIWIVVLIGVTCLYYGIRTWFTSKR